jgi:dTDP-4-dehydrorhamnose 3,5-epimerase-like enzyme
MLSLVFDPGLLRAQPLEKLVWISVPRRMQSLEMRTAKNTRNEDIMNKVIIEKLPNTKEIRGAKRWEEERGEFVQIAYQEAMHHLVVFEIRKGFSRGDHYHEKKEEIFYVFQGKIKASFIDMDTLLREERILEKGEKIRVKPRCGHIFFGLEDTLVIEYSPQVYDKEDTHRIDLT